MKKRMLVTTIALVLVIAVALTTSSLAWFSSSSSVKTGEVTFTASSASGTNLVLGDYGETNLTLYGNSVSFVTGGLNYKPVQGKVTFEGAIEETNNKLSFTTNPFYKPTENGVVQENGYAVAGQKVTFQGASADDYYAGGFNFANATGDAISGGVTLNATITLAPVENTSTAIDAGKVKKGFVAYDGGWKKAGDDVTASAVFYEAQDVALMASIRIAVCGAADVREGATYVDTDAKVYAWGDRGFTLDNTGYSLVAGDSQNKYVPDDPTDSEKKYTDATAKYAETIHGITYADGEFTFSYSFPKDISPDEAGSIAFVIWMDGWDESALPGVSEGKFTIKFELTK